MQAKYLLLFRSVLAETLLLLFLYAPNEPFQSWWVWALLIAYMAMAFGLYWLGRRHKISELYLACSFIMDIGLTSLVLYCTHAFNSDFYVAYFLVILASCFLENLAFSFIIGGVACLVYSYFAFPGWQEPNPFYLLRSSLLLVSAFFSTYVADSSRRIERDAAKRYGAKLAWMQRLYMMGRTLTAVLHEAKTPLSTILLNLDEIQELTRRGKDIRKPLAVIRQEAERTVAILSSFLEFATPKELERKPLKLRQPLEKALDTVRLNLKNRGIRLDARSEANPTILGSERHLVQAFVNILLNAIEAMPTGGQLCVRASTRDTRVDVEFTDTGLGMTRETLDRLFNDFFTTKPKGGHGLGLTVVHWIVEKHSGELHILSDGLKKGTRVVVSLPLLKS